MPSPVAGVIVAGVGLFLASVAFMHAVQPELSPVDMAVSYYMNGSWGWVLGVGLMALGGASLLLAARLRHVVPGAGAGCSLLAVWGLGCIAGGLFPPDPPGHWDEPSSISGMIHGGAAMVAFVAFPVAALLLSRSVARASEASRPGRVLMPLAVSCATALGAFFICLMPVFSNRPPYVLGLVERVLLALYAGWLVAVSASVTSDPRATRHTEFPTSSR